VRAVPRAVSTIVANERGCLARFVLWSSEAWGERVVGSRALVLYRGRGGGQSMSVTPGWGRWTPSFPHLIRGENDGLPQRRWMSEGLDE